MLSRALLLASNSGYNQTWNLDSFSYLGTPMNDVWLDTYAPYSMFFKPDGTKLYTMAYRDITTYSLPVAWDVTSLSPLGQSDSVQYLGSGLTGNFRGIYISPDGLRLYCVHQETNNVRQYSLSTAWDPTTSSFVRTFNIYSSGSTYNSVFFSPDGVSMYVIGESYPYNSGNHIHQYTLSIAWDISTATSYYFFPLDNNEPISFVFSPNGEYVYCYSRVAQRVSQYYVATPWDLKTVSTTTVPTYTFSSNAIRSIFVRSNGSRLYALNFSNHSVTQSDIGTVWDVSTTTYQYPTTRYIGFPSNFRYPRGLFFTADGKKMYFVGDYSTFDYVYQYELSIAWELSSASFVQQFSLTAQETYPTGVFFKPDGLTMYISGSNGSAASPKDAIYQYELSVAWDISTAIFNQYLTVTTETTNPMDLFFKPDGTKMYVVGHDNNTVLEYSLSTAWSVSSASYSQNYSTSTTIGSPAGIFFKYDGTRMYLSGGSAGLIVEFSLSTPWDVTTASYVRVMTKSNPPNNIVPESGPPQCLAFNPLGSRMYVGDTTTNAIWQYDLT